MIVAIERAEELVESVEVSNVIFRFVDCIGDSSVLFELGDEQ